MPPAAPHDHCSICLTRQPENPAEGFLWVSDRASVCGADCHVVHGDIQDYVIWREINSTYARYGLPPLPRKSEYTGKDENGKEYVFDDSMYAPEAPGPKKPQCLVCHDDACHFSDGRMHEVESGGTLWTKGILCGPQCVEVHEEILAYRSEQIRKRKAKILRSQIRDIAH